MTLTIGIAIPCYDKHIHYIPELLENIASSTVKPNSIIISCSSWNKNDIQILNVQGIPVKIIFHKQVLNQAQNRNIAGNQLTTDIISFIDADDLMHPRRIEFLLEVFEKNLTTSVVYHNYEWCHISKRKDPFWEEPELQLVREPFSHNESGIGLRLGEYSIHHAHVTVRKHVFNVFKFDEHPSEYRREDSVYGTLLKNHNVPMLYLNNQLSRYIHN